MNNEFFSNPEYQPPREAGTCPETDVPMSGVTIGREDDLSTGTYNQNHYDDPLANIDTGNVPGDYDEVPASSHEPQHTDMSADVHEESGETPDADTGGTVPPGSIPPVPLGGSSEAPEPGEPHENGEYQPPQVLVELNFTDELGRLTRAAKQLGDITLRIFEDPDEARAALINQHVATLRTKYPDETEEAYHQAAEAKWPTDRMGSYSGEAATHRVTELIFTGRHGRRDLQFMAAHGFVEGMGGNL